MKANTVLNFCCGFFFWSFFLSFHLFFYFSWFIISRPLYFRYIYMYNESYSNLYVWFFWLLQFANGFFPLLFVFVSFSSYLFLLIKFVLTLSTKVCNNERFFQFICLLFFSTTFLRTYPLQKLIRYTMGPLPLFEEGKTWSVYGKVARYLNVYLYMCYV